MTDLDAAIRAKLASRGDDPCGYATWVYHGIDIEAAGKQPGFNLGFHAGLLYAQCRKETGTAPSVGVDGG